ncbi:response regulator [Sulfitobacter sp. S190]|uniref:response regulator n=1 Tax=Sulfitobacter sp. S190 TaxID=2867022 RepID=UPI0021A91594|nr:response regulator [Sulfitobacter sp. S190]UWR22271.1 response regulator [Sulfitobacter sp. S190]
MQQNVVAAARHRGQTCLIIEDSQFDQQMMTRVMTRNYGHIRVEVASTLESARTALKRGGVSLILLDNNLPDGIGANFALELASDPALGRIPVIMVSDFPTPFMWEKAASAGVLYVVNKSEFGARYVAEALGSGGRRRAGMN